MLFRSSRSAVNLRISASRRCWRDFAKEYDSEGAARKQSCSQLSTSPEKKICRHLYARQVVRRRGMIRSPTTMHAGAAAVYLRYKHRGVPERSL